MKTNRAEIDGALTDEIKQNKNAASEVKIEDPVLEEALRRALQIGPASLITKEELRKLRSLRVEGAVRTLRGLEYAENLSEILLNGALVDDLSPLYQMELEKNVGKDESQLRLLRVKLENHQAQDVSFLEKVPDESGIQIYLYGRGPAVEKAFEKYCSYEPVSIVKNYGDCVIYGECMLPWLFFEDGTISYTSDNEEVLKVWGPFFGESVEVKVGDCTGSTVITARAGDCVKKICVTVK